MEEPGRKETELMRIQTFSIVVGSQACDASCPFCISKVTGFEQLPKGPEINQRNLKKAIRLAQMSGTTTVLLTGKGEPTLYPQQITTYLQELGDFPFIELQTNGIRIGRVAQRREPSDSVERRLTSRQITRDRLEEWRDHGLNTIAISTVGINPADNQRIYHEDYPPLERTVSFLRSLGFTVRLCVMMQKGMVDTFDKVHEVAKWCKTNDVAQLTVRPIRRSSSPLAMSEMSAEERYVAEFGLTSGDETAIRDLVHAQATHIHTLMNGAHAARIYDWDGQNICVSDCLTSEPASDDIRTLIYYPSGELSYDWQYPGARLL